MIDFIRFFFPDYGKSQERKDYESGRRELYRLVKEGREIAMEASDG